MRKNLKQIVADGFKKYGSITAVPQYRDPAIDIYERRLTEQVGARKGIVNEYILYDRSNDEIVVRYRV